MKKHRRGADAPTSAVTHQPENYAWAPDDSPQAAPSIEDEINALRGRIPPKDHHGELLRYQESRVFQNPADRPIAAAEARLAELEALQNA